MPSFTCLCGCSGVRRVLKKLLNQVRPRSLNQCMKSLEGEVTLNCIISVIHKNRSLNQCMKSLEGEVTLNCIISVIHKNRSLNQWMKSLEGEVTLCE